MMAYFDALESIRAGTCRVLAAKPFALKGRDSLVLRMSRPCEGPASFCVPGFTSTRRTSLKIARCREAVRGRWGAELGRVTMAPYVMSQLPLWQQLEGQH